MNITQWVLVLIQQAQTSPEVLGAVAQYGAVGICLALIVLIYRVMGDYRKSIDTNTEVLRQVSISLEGMRVTLEGLRRDQ